MGLLLVPHLRAKGSEYIGVTYAKLAQRLL